MCIGKRLKFGSKMVLIEHWKISKMSISKKQNDYVFLCFVCGVVAVILMSFLFYETVRCEMQHERNCASPFFPYNLPCLIFLIFHISIIFVFYVEGCLCGMDVRYTCYLWVCVACVAAPFNNRHNLLTTEQVAFAQTDITCIILNICAIFHHRKIKMQSQYPQIYNCWYSVCM